MSKSSFGVPWTFIIWATDGRSSFHDYVFLKEVLKFCENKPEIIVDSFTEIWVKYWYETFGERNSVEELYSLLKGRTNRF